MRLHLQALLACTAAGVADAATAEQWRSRSIYQLLTDRCVLLKFVYANSCSQVRTLRRHYDRIMQHRRCKILRRDMARNHQTVRLHPQHGFHGGMSHLFRSGQHFLINSLLAADMDLSSYIQYSHENTIWRRVPRLLATRPLSLERPLRYSGRPEGLKPGLT
jgi:hypothetical protein